MGTLSANFRLRWCGSGPVMRRASLLLFSLLLSNSAHGAVPRHEAPASVLPPSQESTSPYSAATAGQFAAACKTDQSSCDAVVGNVLMDRMQFSPTSHLCLSGVCYANAVVPWLSAHPETANMPVQDGVYLALTAIYKCGAPNNY